MPRFRAEHRHAGGIDSVEAPTRDDPDLQAFIAERRAELKRGETIHVLDAGELGAVSVTTVGDEVTAQSRELYGRHAEASLGEGIAAAEASGAAAVVLAGPEGKRRFERRRAAWLETAGRRAEGTELERHEAAPDAAEGRSR